MMKIEDRIISVRTGETGTVVTGPEEILGIINYGIEFDNPEARKLFNPFYVPEELLVSLKEY